MGRFDDRRARLTRGPLFGQAFAPFAVLVLVLAGCAGRNVQLADEWLPIALTARVKLAGEPTLDRESGKTIELRIKGTAVDVRRGPRSPRPYRLVVKTSDNTHHVFFAALADDAPFPVTPGETVSIQYAARWDKKAGVSRRALVVRDGRDRIVLVFQDNGLLDQRLLPKGLDLQKGRDVVYTEAGRRARLCLVVIEHRKLELLAGGAKSKMRPGERRLVTVEGTTWLVAAVDNAITIKGECGGYQPDRLAWFAVRVPE